MTKKILLICLLNLLLSAFAFSQTDAEIEKMTTFTKPENAPQVAILGVYHFANPGFDFAKNEVADVLSEPKQKEILQIVELLSKFKPTKIAIELKAEESEKINKEYADYLAGKFKLTENEVYQLGFRLAKNHNHKQLYLIDYPGGMNINSVIAYAQKNDSEYAKRFQADIGKFTNLMNQMQKTKSILEILRVMNKQDTLNIAQSLYTDMATVGASDNYIGADVVSDWYKRNLKIYANLNKIAEPNDRILFIIGQGHKPILQQLVKESARMKLVEVLDFL